MGFPNPFKEAEKAAKKAVDKVIKPATDAAERIVDKCKDKAEDAIDDALGAAKNSIKWNLNKAKDGIRTAQRETEKAIQKAGDEIEEGLTEKLPDLVKDAVHDLAEEASERSIANALNGAADVIEMMAPDSFTLIFGIELALVVQAEVTIAVELPNPAARLTEIRKWAKDAPNGRAEIIDCIKDFAPESLSVEAKVSGNGLAASWSGESKYSRLDAFLERHGVS